MMCKRDFLQLAGLLLAGLMLTACGPGGGNSGDVFPRETQTSAVVTGPNSFLLFPNPQKQSDGSLQTNTTAYATAYYVAVDPTNAKDTLTKWKAANGFGNSATGTEVSVVFGDVKDLGYGRRMTARKNNDGTIAFWVENYLVSAAANYTYSSLNLDAAVVRDKRWHVGTNAIDYSPPPGVAVTADCGNCYPKFFTYHPTSEQRLLEAQLDGRGTKAMPGICINCHGGRGDPLRADGSFPRSVNSLTLSGDVQAHLQSFVVDSFGYSSAPGYTRADQEAKFRTINQWVLCSYPLKNGTVKPTGNAEDVCRRVAGSNEWQGSAAEMVKHWYGGSGMASSTFSDTDVYVPMSWRAASSTVATETLYKSVIAPTCRVCHVLRGTENQTVLPGYDADISFMTYSDASNKDFVNYADRIKVHVFDRGNMPLGKLIYERFWNSTQPETLATFLESKGKVVRDTSNVLLQPGRPVADPGPARTTINGATLSAANSLFASTYNWSVSAGGTLSNPTSVQTTLTTTGAGTYVVTLVVGNGVSQSPPVSVNITIAASATLELPKAPADIHFSDIKTFIQGSTPGCTGCHYYVDPASWSGIPPIFYDNYDRNGSGSYSSTGVSNDLTNDDWWFYKELLGRINFTDVAASPLLLKPTGHHHNGGLIIDTASAGACTGSCVGYANLGAFYTAYYNMIVLWILNGAPY